MRIMLLNDGETYTAAEGCRLVEVPDMDDMEIETLLADGGGETLATFNAHGELGEHAGTGRALVSAPQEAGQL